MKKRNIIYLFMLLFTILASCQNDLKEQYKYDAVKAELKVTTDKLSYEGHGGDKTLSINSNTFWEAGSSMDWIHLNPEEGRGSMTITVSADPNPSTREERQAVVTIQNGLQSYQINIVQALTPEKLEVNKKTVNFSAQAGNDNVTVNSNVSWSVSSDDSWCTVSPRSETEFSIQVSQNKSYSPRNTKVNVKGLDKSLIVSVEQAGAKEPTIKSISESGVTNTEAKISFTFSSPDIEVYRYGVCYSTSETQPTINNSLYVDQYLTGYERNVSCALKNLTMDTGYYYRCFVETEGGITYSEVNYFKTLAIIAPEENDNIIPNF